MMKIRSLLVAVGLGLCSLPLHATNSSLSIRLAVEPSNVLPGIPASLHVVVSNSGETPAVLPAKVLLRVVPSKGVPFIATWGAAQEHRFAGAEIPADRPTREVPSHGERTFIFPAREFGQPGWFYDPRLNAPGKYRLQLLIGAYDENTVATRSALEVDTAEGFTSTEAVLNIETPRGDDAALWNQLVALTKGKSGSWSPSYWSPAEAHDFANIAAKHPSSPYAAYAIPYFWSPSAEKRVAVLQSVLDAQPTTPVRENIELLVAQAEVSAAHQAASGPTPNLSRATTLCDRARRALETLERTASDPLIRALSKQDLDRLPTADDLRETIAPPKD